MTQSSIRFAMTRRRLLISAGCGGAAAAAMAIVPGLALADADSVAKSMQALIGSAEPTEGRVELDLPQIAENGNTVPISLAIDSPMTADDYVKAVHVFADGNPRPDVASFFFSPACGEATCSTRIRLAKTQNIITVAEMSGGEVYMAKAEVKVTIGGCGG